MDIELGGAPSVRRLFGDEMAVPAILEFLKEARVGKAPSRILLAGGLDLEEEKLECISLQVQEEGEGTGASTTEAEGPPPPPSLEMYLSFVRRFGGVSFFSFVCWV